LSGRDAATRGAPVAVDSLAAALEALPGARVLDLRSAARFAQGHAAGAGRLAPDEFETRRMELPAREQPVLLVHDEPGVARAAAEDLAARGFPRLAWLALPIELDPQGLASRAAPARLWSPSVFLERVHGRAPQGPALDLACGTGRATVFLALAGRDAQGWDVDESALTRARAFAERAGAARATFRAVDLERGPLPEPEPRYALIVVVRFLHRELFPWIERSLAPGGALVYETFRQGQERFGPPTRERHLLAPGELPRALPGLEVEEHEESDAAVPPVMTRLLARRPR
jgi:SAM-dependent methyltransferase